MVASNVMVGLYCHLNDRSTGLSSLSLVLGSMHVVTRNLLQVFFGTYRYSKVVNNMDNHAIHFSNVTSNFVCYAKPVSFGKYSQTFIFPIHCQYHMHLK